MHAEKCTSLRSVKLDGNSFAKLSADGPITSLVRHNTFLSANSMQAKTAKVKNFTNVHVFTLKKKCYLFTLFDKIKR